MENYPGEKRIKSRRPVRSLFQKSICRPGDRALKWNGRCGDGDKWTCLEMF